MKVCLNVCVVTVLMLPASVQLSAQNSNKAEIVLCNHAYSLGQSKERVLSDFTRGACRLTPIESSAADTSVRSYMVAAKDSPSTVFGQLSFVGSALTYVARDWSEEAHSEADLGRVLIEILHQYDQNGQNNCTMQTTFASGPDFDRKSAALRCGPKVLDIEWVDYKSSKSIQITESLGIS